MAQIIAKADKTIKAAAIQWNYENLNPDSLNT